MLTGDAIRSAGLLEPAQDMSPVSYADMLAHWFAENVSEERKKERGQYFTPPEIAHFMAQWCELDRKEERILDVGAGTGILTCALVEKAVADRTTRVLHVDAYENDPDLACLAARVLGHARQWASQRGCNVHASVIKEDFVLANGEALGSGTLWGQPCARYSRVIMNPPYFKLRKLDPRAQRAKELVHGQPNIYAICMGIAAHLLVPNGTMVSISPRSFTTGLYFRCFRQALLRITVPEAIHLFDSRKDTFAKDDVLQENVIMRVRRRSADVSGLGAKRLVGISSSRGISDISNRHRIQVPLPSVIDLTSYEKMLFIPTTQAQEQLRKWMLSWPHTLRSLAVEVSTGPVVAFRAKALLRYHNRDFTWRGKPLTDVAPLLMLNNVDVMDIDWPLEQLEKPQGIMISPESMKLLVPLDNYVLTRRFTSKEQKKRIVAAPLTRGDLDAPYIGLENHLNYIYRVEGALTMDETYGLAGLLNSRLVDTYFRILNGHTQVNATELRALPLPAMDVIRAIGIEIQQSTSRTLDSIVETVLGAPAGLVSEGETIDG